MLKGQYFESRRYHDDGDEGDRVEPFVTTLLVPNRFVSNRLVSSRLFHEERRPIYTFPSGMLSLVGASEGFWKV